MAGTAEIPKAKEKVCQVRRLFLVTNFQELFATTIFFTLAT